MINPDPENNWTQEEIENFHRTANQAQPTPTPDLVQLMKSKNCLEQDDLILVKCWKRVSEIKVGDEIVTDRGVSWRGNPRKNLSGVGGKYIEAIARIPQILEDIDEWYDSLKDSRVQIAKQARADKNWYKSQPQLMVTLRAVLLIEKFFVTSPSDEVLANLVETALHVHEV